MKIRSAIGAAAVLFGACASSHAATLTYAAPLSGAAESPPNNSPATGFVTVDVDDVAHTMRVQATFSGLLGTTTAAHIHGPTFSPGEGTAGVATTTPSFPGFPLGVNFGSFDTTLDLTLATSYNPAFITANGGNVAGAEAALLAALAQGRAYFNVHTAQFPGGEIRGFPTVPEPTTLALAAAGAALVARRRR